MTKMQIIPPIVLPGPKPYYGVDYCLWVQMGEDEREELRSTYEDSVRALKEIYAVILNPIAVVK